MNINGDINLTGNLYQNGSLLISSLNASNISSGTLSVGYGGTGLTSLSSGLILVGNGDNPIIQSSNLVWDNTNNRLGIGKTEPETTLDINGIIKSTGIICSDGALVIDSNNNVNIGYGNLYFDGIYNNIGIGTIQPDHKLHIVGDTRIEGNLIVNGTSTIINTDVSNTEQLIITNDGTGPAVIINQTGAEPIIEFQDDGETCFKIFDGGHVGMGTNTKNINVDISGNLKLSGIISGQGSDLFSLNASNISSGTLSMAYGGIGTTTLASGSVLIGNGSNTLIQPTNFVWNSASTRLGVGKTNPTTTLDVNGVITGTGSGLTSLNATNISAGTLSVARGGTGSTTLTAGTILIGNGTGVLIQSANLNWNNTSTRLGIGLTNPQRTAHVQSALRIGGASATLDFGDDLNNQIYKNGTNNDILIRTAGTDKVIINSLGNLGIGTTNPGFKLHTVGDIAATGTITANYSDERLKTVISNIKNPLNIINNLNGFYYVPNELAKTYGIYSTSKEIGLSAQEIQKELPEIVKLAPFDSELKNGEIISKSGENYLTISYERLAPLFVEAIKELRNEINDLKNKINNTS